MPPSTTAPAPAPTRIVDAVAALCALCALSYASCVGHTYAPAMSWQPRLPASSQRDLATLPKTSPTPTEAMPAAATTTPPVFCAPHDDPPSAGGGGVTACAGAATVLAAGGAAAAGGGAGSAGLGGSSFQKCGTSTATALPSAA